MPRIAAALLLLLRTTAALRVPEARAPPPAKLARRGLLAAAPALALGAARAASAATAIENEFRLADTTRDGKLTIGEFTTWYEGNDLLSKKDLFSFDLSLPEIALDLTGLAGWPLLERLGKLLRLPPERLEGWREQFRSKANQAVLLGRFVAVLRILAGPMAGAVAMPYGRFLLCNSIGAVLWASTMVSLAWLCGRWLPLEQLLLLLSWSCRLLLLWFLLPWSLQLLLW